MWLCGLIAPFTWQRLRELRFVSIAYVALFVAAVALEAKGYYIIGIYGALLAVGAVVVERAFVWLRIALFAARSERDRDTTDIDTDSPDQGFIGYSQLLGLTGRGANAHVIQPIYAEQFGWDRLARDVATVYSALPDRANVAIYADTYADAGAIDFFGPTMACQMRLAVKTRIGSGVHMDIAAARSSPSGHARIDLVKHYYRSCKLARESNEPLKWVVKGPAPIFVCTGPTMPLEAIWPHLRWYGA